MVEPPIAKQYIDGEWCTAGTESFDVINPATEEVVATVPSATDEEVSNALAAADRAQDEWKNRPGIERANLLREMGDVIEESVADVAPLLVAEQGKPRSSAESEIVATADLARYVAGWGRRIEGDIVPSDNERESIHLQRHPVGTVVGIVPWNYPISIFTRKVFPALIAGNSIVVKPSEETPLATIRLLQRFDEELDLPDGLVNLVLGGGQVGERLVTADRTDYVTMTGSTETGKAIMRAAADSLTPVSLELGGKAPAIVCADADIDEAVEDVLTARITNAGQVCTCAERVYVHESVAEEFTEKYVEAASAVSVGDPTTDPDMGPQVNTAELRKTDDAVRSAVDDGASVRLGGQTPAGSEFERGYWYEPTVLTDVDQSMDVIQSEVFGPVTPIVPVSSVEEAIEYANDVEYGLSSYVYTTDYRTAMRAAEELEYGETYLNRTLGEAWQGHHIGWKESGLGGEDGKYGVLKYTQLKSVYHDYS
ncbi:MULTISPECIES: aldehyde dehydrogenase [Halorussus]|uniref:aldehyde dehydrogenase n=1 Tax=Halorussus TaxID=1070314 RepID=UPI00209F08DC|nr:aldehyde dehydrogenase [Halorussus vallis]USZ77405.1 aldehyde dehydrogenase [Halorussus vallis]